MSGYPIIFGEGVDPDAYQYFLRAGIESGTQTPTAYDNAASFNGTNQFLSVASNSSLTVTGTSFTFAFWANTPNTSNGMVISKTAGTDTREFQIGLRTSGVAEFRLFPDGIFANGRLVETSASSFSANTWNFFAYRYDSSAATIGISVNGGAFTTLGSIPAITQTNTNPLNLGVFVNTASGVNYTGQLASVGFWKKALSASEVTQLWNNGAGRTYASLDTGLRTNLISWWALNQNSVTADSHTTGNNLTNNGTPLVTATTLGPIVTTTQNSRQLINNFVKGIKSLGLWNSMVCWPLRSSQNANGTTAFSLGGLGTFDGTLVSSGGIFPSWRSTGMLTTTIGPKITTTRQLFGYSQRSLFCVNALYTTSVGFSRSRLIGTGFSEPRFIQYVAQCSGIHLRGGGGGVAEIANGNPSTPSNYATTGNIPYSLNANFTGMTYNSSSNLTAYQNDSVNGTPVSISSLSWAGSLNDSYGLWLFNSYDNDVQYGGFLGTISTAFDFNVSLTPAQVSNLYNLVRATLAIGVL